MSSLIQSLRSLFDFSAHPEQHRDDLYLAEAADIYDLERRMRQLDSGRSDLSSIGASGIFSR